MPCYRLYLLTLESDIPLPELSSGEHYYRGDGVFLGWSQEQLASVYRALLPEQPEAEAQALQLG